MRSEEVELCRATIATTSFRRWPTRKPLSVSQLAETRTTLTAYKEVLSTALECLHGLSRKFDHLQEAHHRLRDAYRHLREALLRRRRTEGGVTMPSASEISWGRRVTGRHRRAQARESGHGDCPTRDRGRRRAVAHAIG